MLRKVGKPIALIGLGVVLAGAAWAHSDEANEFGFGHPGMMSDITRTVDVDMMDSTFNHKAIDIKPGETIRFMLHNRGELPHEFAIATPAMHKEHQEEMMNIMGMMETPGMGMGSGMGPGMMSALEGEHEDPNSVLLQPGQSGELIWHFEGMENIEFACDIPGHYEDGMHGQFMYGQ